MTKIQKAVVVAFAILLAALCLYVPWRETEPFPPFFLGYGPLWGGPIHEWYLGHEVERGRARIDVEHLLVEIAAATSVFVALFFIAGFKRAGR